MLTAEEYQRRLEELNATTASNPQVVQLLFNEGADVNQPSRGSTPLTLARQKGNAAVLTSLKSAGAKE